MKRRQILMLAALTWASPALAVGSELSPASIRSVLEHTLVDYIRPQYAAFEQAAVALETTVETLCDAPSEATLAAARGAFRDVAGRWAQVEWLRIGPVMSENRLERIYFFPDRKGTGRKQVQAAIAGKDEGVTDAAALAANSVAMQGLGALEYILFGTGSEALATATAGHRCGYARAAASNLATMAGDLTGGWGADTSLSRIFVAPDAQNPLFRSDREALNLLLGTLIHGLEAIRDTRLGAFLDSSDKHRDRPKLAPLWRADMTMASLSANLKGLEALFNASTLETAAVDPNGRLGNTIRFEFTQAIRTAESLDAPLADMLADPQTRDKLVYLGYAIRIIIDRLDQDFAQAAGLSTGFSFGDGD